MNKMWIYRLKCFFHWRIKYPYYWLFKARQGHNKKRIAWFWVFLATCPNHPYLTAHEKFKRSLNDSK